MTSEWILKFAEFAATKGAPLVSQIIDAFQDEYPELKAPPPVDAKEMIDKDIDRMIDEKFRL